jgi:hypothetical protein
MKPTLILHILLALDLLLILLLFHLIFEKNYNFSAVVGRFVRYKLRFSKLHNIYSY